MSRPDDDGSMPGPLYQGAHAEVTKHESAYLRVRLSQTQYRVFHAWLTTQRRLAEGPLDAVLARVLDQVPAPK